MTTSHLIVFVVLGFFFHATALSPCDLKPEGGPCRASFKRYHFDSVTKKCTPFVWGGCKGVVPFQTKSDCEAACEVNPCSEVPQTGPCKARFIRYFFDNKREKCRPFVYGGCKGNVPFQSKSECERARCIDTNVEEPPQTDACRQKPSRGPCRASKTRYFYDGKAGKCTAFKWGGCGGSVPFPNKKACEKAWCKPDKCFQPGITGPCRAGITKYLWNAKKGRCERFTWGGCKGSVPFDTLDECIMTKCPVA